MESCSILICIFTVRKRSCGKVIFLHLSVSHSVHGGCLPQCMLGCTLPGRHHPWAETHPSGHTPPLHRPPTSRRPLQRTVRILLERFLVAFKINLRSLNSGGKLYKIEQISCLKLSRIRIKRKTSTYWSSIQDDFIFNRTCKSTA